METSLEIKNKLREIVGFEPNLPMRAEVVAVSGGTCSVKLQGSDLVIEGVRLQATDDTKGLIMTPKLNSEILVMSQSGHLTDLFILKFSLLEKIEIKQNNLNIVANITTEKIKIQNQTTDLKTLFNQWLNTIKTAVIDTPVGPGAINASTQAQLTNIQTQINQLFD